MAQSGYTPISLYFSATGAAVPTAANLVAGELALNTNDGKLYFKNSAGVVTLLAGSTSGPAGGSTTQVQYNNSGVLAGITGATTNGTALTLVAPNLGTPASATLTLATGLPISTGVSGLGTNVATALGVNTGTAGAFVVNGGALGSPSSVGTMPAFTLGGTVSGGGNQINNVVIGTTTPLAGAFTSLTASTTLGVTGVSTLTGGAVIQGLTVGLGAGAVSTNTAVGVSALSSNSTGASNTALGAAALQNNTTASDNTAVGYQAAYSSTTASKNTAVGYQAGYSFSTSGASANSTALGYQALYTGGGGADVAVGYQALYALNINGGATVGIGNDAGSNLITGYYGIYIGQSSKAGSTSAINEIVIGRNSTGKGSTTGFIDPGTGPVYQGNNSSTWSVTSDQRLKKNIVDNNIGLEKINAIQVRNFEYRLPEEINEVPQNQAVKKQGVQLGVIAQELQQILPECVRTESTGVMSIDTDNLIWYAINSIKELKSQLDSVKAELATLKGA